MHFNDDDKACCIVHDDCAVASFADPQVNKKKYERNWIIFSFSLFLFTMTKNLPDKEQKKEGMRRRLIMQINVH